MTNDLRMPFAEWLFRMSEADVPYQARSLAVYAVLFKVSANDELARLSGMDTKGLADKTYNKWKRLLCDTGWVIIKSVTIGRSTTIEIYPALNASPVTFTDAIPRDPARFGQNKSYERGEEVTSESYGSTVKTTGEDGKVTVGKVEITADKKTSPAPARVVDIYNIYNNTNQLEKNTPPPSEQVAARESVGGLIVGPGEEHIGHGVIVNCETVRHRDFVISLKSIELQLCGSQPMETIKASAVGHALQWALEIEGGKPAAKVLPDKPASFIRASLQNQRRNDMVAAVKMDAAKPKGPKLSRWGR